MERSIIGDLDVPKAGRFTGPGPYVVKKVLKNTLTITPLISVLAEISSKCFKQDSFSKQLVFPHRHFTINVVVYFQVLCLFEAIRKSTLTWFFLPCGPKLKNNLT